MRDADPASMTAPFDGLDDSQTGIFTIALSIACVAFLGFIIGGFTMYRDIFPAPALRGAFKGGTSLYDRLTQYTDPVETDFWKPARTQAQGVIHLNRHKAQPGLTLYTSAHDQRAFLVDLRGARCDLGLGELADGIAQRVDVFAQGECAHAWNP